jgi:hypothetical protein
LDPGVVSSAKAFPVDDKVVVVVVVVVVVSDRLLVAFVSDCTLVFGPHRSPYMYPLRKIVGMSTGCSL